MIFYYVFFAFVALTASSTYTRANLSVNDFEELEDEFPESKQILNGAEGYANLYLHLYQTLQKPTKKTDIWTQHLNEWRDTEENARNTGSQFPCQISHSTTVPDDVNKLRPSDIKVMATIGDSISAGMGIFSKTIISIATQWRGHSFTGGCADTVENHVTFPAILKKFNSKLHGCSKGISGPDGVYSNLNVAIVGHRAENMPEQARTLVARMKESKNVDFEKDWKVINLFIGGNDICDFCKDKERFSPDNYEKHIRDALDYFYEHVPRAFVNLVEILNVGLLHDISKQKLTCNAIIRVVCRCGTSQSKEVVTGFSRELQKRAQIIADDSKWTSKKDFTVVLQPFLRNLQPPKLPNGDIDLSYLAPDCFHFGAKGHALGGISLWNNMLQPVGSKKTDWTVNDKIQCPTANRPYFATKLNSISSTSDDKLDEAIKWIEKHIPEVSQIENKRENYMKILQKVIDAIEGNPQLRKIMENDNPTLFKELFGQKHYKNNIIDEAIDWVYQQVPEVKNIHENRENIYKIIGKVMDAVNKHPKYKRMLENEGINFWKKLIGDSIDVEMQNENQLQKLVEQQVPEASKIMNNDEGYVNTANKVYKSLMKNNKFSKLMEEKKKKHSQTFEHTGMHFPCSLQQSSIPPDNVHQLRPTDVKVMAAIGDSLTAGMGIYSKTLLTIATQWRGHSFTMGGKEDISQHVTLATILKKFSPKLFGYSTGISGPDGIYAGFSEAIVGNRAEDMPTQARKLVARMRKSHDIDYEKDWKVINLFIGGNDICDFCKDEDRFSPDNYEKHIRDALDYLYEHVPRAFVNLVEILDVSIIGEIKHESFVCKTLLSTFWCKCGATQPEDKVEWYSTELQKRAQRIAQESKWTQKNDFTVVLQPFLRHFEAPRVPSTGKIDMTYLAPDCFHFSAKGHALAGLALWNNMMEPVGSKSTNWKVGDSLKCPTTKRPYLATTLN